MTWYLDGVNLSTYAWNVKHRSSGWTVPGKTGENVQIPGRHGSFWTPNKTYDEGHLTLSMWAAGCEPDGSMPITADGRTKVRQNLDKLTSMFATSRRLLNLRQETGDGHAMINDLSNPTLVSNYNTGQKLVTNAFSDPARQFPTNTEVSRNISTNPYLKGRTSSKVVYTEDMYPDPGLNNGADNKNNNLISSYYYPINQDAPTTNQFFLPSNGFSMRTGMYGGRGVIRRPGPVTYTGDAHIGFFTKEVWANRDNGVIFFAQIKLNGNAPASSVNVLVRPYVSDDGITWTTGPTTSSITLNKSTYTWIVMPATSLPSLVSGPNRFWVRYNLQIVGGSSWNGGDAFDLQYVAIQDSPPVGNPWRAAPTPTMMIVDKETPLAVNRAGSSQMGWTDFAKPQAPGWTALMDLSTASTAPYAFAWCSRDKAYNNEGNLNFTVFGGTKNTFRRVLPSPRNSLKSQAWGRYRKTGSGVATVRVTERTGPEGGYAYNLVTSINLTNASEYFTTPAFDVVAGKTYCLEIDVPAGSNGLTPSIVFRELHVSNAIINTLMPKGKTADSTYAGASSKYVGSIYNSTIEGTGYAPFGAVTGVPSMVSKATTTTNVDWSKEPQRLMSREGKLDMGIMTAPSNLSVRRYTINLRAAFGLPEHLSKYPFLPNSASATMTVKTYTASGTLVQTVPYTMNGLTAVQKSYGLDVTVGPTETKIGVEFSHYYSTYPMSMLVLSQFNVMVNRPPSFTSFTGALSETIATWTKQAVWAGKAYFSESKLLVLIPPSWSIPGFEGFDSKGAIQTTGSSISVSTGNLQPGTAIVGLRRGDYTNDITVTATAEGGSSTTLGTITSTKDWVSATVAIPADATYITFGFSDAAGTKGILDVFCFQEYSNVFPVAGSTWPRFSTTKIPTIPLPAHPSYLTPSYSVSKYSNSTMSVQTGAVNGWSGPVLSGGYVVAPRLGELIEVASSPVPATSGLVSAAMRVQLQPGLLGKVSLKLQGTTDGITWTTLSTQSVNHDGYYEYKIIDTVVPAGNSAVRLMLEVNNGVSPITMTGVAAIIDGAAIVKSVVPLGSNFPGYFVGVRGSDGISQYQGHIRQALVEVTESVDMESMAYGTIAEFNVNLNVPGAFWEDVYDTQDVVQAVGSAKSGTFYLTDFKGATAPMQDVIIDITPMTGTIKELTIEDRGSGNYTTYSGPAQTKISINTTLSTVTNESSLSIIRYISGMASSNIMSVTPYIPSVGEAMPENLYGVPLIDWTCNTPIKITVTGRRKYLIG